MNAPEQFKAAMLDAGYTPPDEVIDDGKVHRFSPEGRKGDTAGWYILHADGIPAGTFGNWRATSAGMGKSPDAVLRIIGLLG